MHGMERIEEAGNANVINPLRAGYGRMLLPAFAGSKQGGFRAHSPDDKHVA